MASLSKVPFALLRNAIKASVIDNLVQDVEDENDNSIEEVAAEVEACTTFDELANVMAQFGMDREDSFEFMLGIVVADPKAVEAPKTYVTDVIKMEIKGLTAAQNSIALEALCHDVAQVPSHCVIAARKLQALGMGVYTPSTQAAGGRFRMDVAKFWSLINITEVKEAPFGNSFKATLK